MRQRPGIQEILRRTNRILSDDTDWIKEVGDELSSLTPFATDAFSRIRYTHYLVRRLIQKGRLESQPAPRPSNPHPLTTLIFQSLDYQFRFAKSGKTTAAHRDVALKDLGEVSQKAVQVMSSPATRPTSCTGGS